MSSGRRVHERYAIALDVILKYPGGELRGVTRNLSLGGALIDAQGTIPYGVEVKLRLRLAQLKDEAEISGVVRWLKDGAIGVQFGSLRAIEVWALNQVFRSAPAVG